MKETKWVLVAATLLTLVGAVSQVNSTNAASPKVHADVPAGQLTIVAAPYVDVDYDSRPAVVQGVNTSTSSRGPGIISAEIVNQSSRPATAVKLRWYLSLDDRKGVVLGHGDTPELPLSPSLEPGASRMISHDLVQYKDVVNLLHAMGRKEGHFRIDVSVTALTLDGRESWKEDILKRLEYKVAQAVQDGQPVLVKASYTPAAITVAKRRACQPNYSQCRWVYTGQGYVPCPPPPGMQCGWVATGYWDCGSPHAQPYRCYINSGGGCSMQYCG